MMFRPRYYQDEAVDSLFAYWEQEPGHALIDMATGTGKSGTAGMVDQRLVTGWPDLRILNCTHVEELVAGNYQELLGIWPFAPAGIFAASLGRRDRNAQILFGQVQTIWNKASEIGWVDVLKIDEVHLVPNDANTMYRVLINDLLAINPDMKIVGFSATLYRLDSGRLDEGDDRLFDKVVYEYGIRRGIDDGYLTPITSKRVETMIDISGVRTTKGDYAPGALAAAVKAQDKYGRIVEEVFDTEGHRKSALFFCPGIENAHTMAELVRAAGRTCEVISGKTPKNERRRLIEAFKRGDIWALSNDNVLSTGTNLPRADLLVDTYKTKSANRYAQRAGRLTRVIYPPGFDPERTDAAGRRDAIANGPKPDARYMDFVGNIYEHGPVDQIEPKRPGKGGGEAPVKLCPQCEEILHASVRVCTCCGHQFEFDTAPKVLATASDAPILSTEEPIWRQVTGRKFQRHEKVGGLPSVRVDYSLGLEIQKDWICPGHTGYPKQRADRYWINHGGQRPFPKNPDEFLARAGELAITTEVRLKKNGRYWNVDAWKAGSAPANDNVPVPANDNAERKRLRAMMDDIPF
ncbi:DEAD/DEAH box helicase [Devosia elaeis]|nr:DEAD/DEAH box helicase [Devosia elaeis]